MCATRRALKIAVLAVLTGVAVAFQPRAFSARLASTHQNPSRSVRCLVVRPEPAIRSTSIVLLSTKATGDEETKAPAPATLKKSLVAASMLIAFDIFCRRLFQAFSIGFPSALAGCGALFATFLLVPAGPQLYNILSPGSALLAKWLPLFFVPSLITLPLADSVGSIAELLKVAFVVVGGFYFTLLTTAWTVVGVRKLLPSKQEDSPASKDATSADEADVNASPPPKAFSDELNNGLRVLTAASFGAAVLSKKYAAALTTPLTSLFMLSTTLCSFVFGARLPKKFIKIVHPLITCAALTWAAALGFARVTGKSFMSMLNGYRTHSLGVLTGGAGDLLLFMLGPAVIALACQMYDKRKLMRENLVEVGSAVTVSSFGGIFGTAAVVRLLQIASPYLRLSLLSRNITSPLAMAIATILGADVSLAVSMVVVTGLIGANFGASILDSFGIKDPVARGLGIGAAAHGLGTAAFVEEKNAFPFAAIAMALTASATTVIVSIPLFKRWILQLAFGA